ncbi:MAG: sulfite exporter TauE/SafE family protein [Flavobacteriaceae bacterium]
MLTTSLTLYSFLLGSVGAFLLGLGKAGIKGMAVFIVVLFVYAFGARSSTGILLPLLIVGDSIAVLYYRQHTDWPNVFRLLPWMALGVLLATYGATFLNETTFTFLMAGLILLATSLMGYWEFRPLKEVPTHWSFAGFLGLLAGFTTMIGNLAGAVVNIYFLVLRFPKNTFIGTTAFVFFFINLFKIPFHVWIWETIQWESLKISLFFIPVELLGLYFGLRWVQYLGDANYRKLILLLTAIGAFALFFK